VTEAEIGIEIEAAIGMCTGVLKCMRILGYIPQGFTPTQESIQTTVAATAVITDVMAEVPTTTAISKGAIETV
jgi:hypothetical protein